MAAGKKTGGRKKGSKNKQKAKLADEVRVKTKTIEGQTPLEYMLEVMRDKESGNQRRDAMACAAAPYLHARRAPEDKQGKTIPPMIYHTSPLEAPDESASG